MLERESFFRMLLALLLLLAVPAVVQGQFIFTTNADNTLTITGYGCPGGAVTIPSATNGLPVTRIGNSAFYNCASLTSVTIPASVTSIGSYAFCFCYSLTTTTIPASVTNIGDYAFASCWSLTNAPVGNSVISIGSYAFYNCYSLTAITIPASTANIGDYAFQSCWGLTNATVGNSVTNVGAGAFWGCTSLTSATVGTSVTSIGSYAFESCARLASITIPASVAKIGSYAFWDCISLITITIPASVNSIGSQAFCSCDRLTAITVFPNNPTYSSADGVLFNKSQTMLIQCPGGKAGSCTIPASVTSIGSQAFYDCTSLTGAYFLGNAPSLGSSVFDGASKLTVYYLPGRTGWTSTFGGRPTVLWNPQVQPSSASFGVRTNRFGFTITGSSNLVIVVEACTNLANRTWSSVHTNILTGGSSYFSDPQWTNYPARLYRLRSP